MHKISPSGLLSTVSWCFDSCPVVLLCVLRSRLLFFVGDASLSLECAFSNLSDLWCWWSWWGTRPELVTWDTSVRRLGKISTNFFPLPGQSHTTSHDSSSEGFGSGFWPSGDTSEKYTAFALTNISWHKSSWIYWIFMSWKSNMAQEWCVAFRNLCVRKRWNIQPDSCLIDLVELWWA